MPNHALWPYDQDQTLAVVPPETFDRVTGQEPHTSYRDSIVRWAVEKLGIPEHTLRWSICPGYYDALGVARHQWDGTPDPIAALFDAIVAGQDVAALSGTGTGKSYAMAIAILWFLACWQDAEVYTFAPTEDQLKLYIWKNIQDLWPRFSSLFPSAELTSLTIRMYGGTMEKWSAHGYPVQLRAGEKVSIRASGMHAEHMMLVYEEMTGIDPAVPEAGKNTCTAPHNFRVGIGNPTWKYDTLCRFAAEPGVKAIRISALDHPNVVAKNPSLIPGAVSQKSIDDRLAKYAETDPIYLARVRGIAPDQAANSLVRLEWLQAAADRYAARVESGWVWDGTVTGKGVDAANSEHGDEAAIADFWETVLVRLDAFPCPDSNKLGAQIVRECIRSGTPEERVGVDAIGVGAGTVNEARRLDFVVQALYAGGKPMAMVEHTLDGDAVEWAPDVNLFMNLRAQMAWQLRVDLQQGVLEMPKDDELWEELLAITFEDDGKETKLNPKDKIREQIGRSPNKADAVVMANWVRSRAAELTKAKEIEQGKSPGYDYKKHRPRKRETGEEYIAKIFGDATGDPLANRFYVPMRES